MEPHPPSSPPSTPYPSVAGVVNQPLPELSPWGEADNCATCSKKFGLVFTRRHHCRACSNSFCSDCLDKNKHRTPWHHEPVQVCKACVGLVAGMIEVMQSPQNNPFDKSRLAFTPSVATTTPTPQYSAYQPSTDILFDAKATSHGASSSTGHAAYIGPQFNVQVTPQMMALDARIASALQFANDYHVPIRWVRSLSVHVYSLRGLPAVDKDGYCKPKITLSVPSEQPVQILAAQKVLNKTPINATGTVYLRSKNANAYLNLSVTQGSYVIGVAKIVPNHMQANTYSDLDIPLEKQAKSAPITTNIRLRLAMSAPALDEFCFTLAQKYFSFGDFDIEDDVGRKCFKVTGSWPSKWRLDSVDGRPILDIRRRSIFAMEPSYDLYNPSNERVMSITKRMNFGSIRFSVEHADGSPSDMSIEGNFFSWNFSVMQGGVAVARVNKKFMSREYGVFIQPGVDIPLLLSACILICQAVKEAQQR